MWGSLFSGAKDFLGSDAFKGLTNLAGTAGGLLQGFQQQKMANKQFDLQKDAYNLNKAEHLNRVEARNKRNQQLEQVWGA